MLPVIPVLDLLDGAVVRAERGLRGTYRPIVTPLAAGHAPPDIAAALLAHPACHRRPPRLYVADLDAIQGRPVQRHALGGLAALVSATATDAELWVDAGFRDAQDVAALDAALGAARWRPVIGSESVGSLAALQVLAADPRAILSLDCRLDRPLDPAGCWEHPEAWPATVIVMTLDRVGARGGPDLATFARLRAAAGTRRTVVGAGGLRDAGDREAARAAGADAWLVASALHDGTLGRAAA